MTRCSELKITIDSAAAESVKSLSVLPEIPTTPPVEERYYRAANGARVRDHTAKNIRFRQEEVA